MEKSCISQARCFALKSIAEKLNVNRRDSLKSYGYSVSATPLYVDAPLVLGINWGGSPESNTPSPPCNWDELRDIGSLRNIKKFLKKYINEDNKFIVQANVSPLRTPKESGLDEMDLKASAKDFLPVLVEFIQPKFILFLGTGRTLSIVHTVFLKKFEVEHFKVQQANKIFWGYHGYFHVADLKVPVLVLPHPMARIKTCTKEKLWDLGFDHLMKNIKNEK